jgi:cobalt/nickel transport protein
MKRNWKWIFILTLLVITAAALPLFLNGLGLTGADDAAGRSVALLDPGYQPWAKPLLDLSGGNAETLLFCLQAGIGAGILGLGFGYLIIRKNKQKG